MSDLEQKKREILDRVDLLDIVSEHVTLKRSGRRFVGLCPFHSEKTPSFTVSPDHQSFKCFGCGQGGDVFSFVQLRENVPFMDAMQMLADRVGIELTKSRSADRHAPGRADLARLNQWAANFFRRRLLDESTGAAARAYLRDRGISDETSEGFRLGLATGARGEFQSAAAKAGFHAELLLAADLLRKSDDGRLYETFRDRLMFPIHDATGKTIGFGGRTLVDDKAKYLNTRQNALFDKGRNLYGIERARAAAERAGRVVVVEGYTDCLACHQFGFEETVATLGTALTDGQVSLLRRYTEQVVLLFDSDEAGEAAADRAILVAVPQCVTVRLARVPDGKDPMDFLTAGTGRSAAFSDLLNAAVDALEFKWRQTQSRFLGEGSDGQRREAVVAFLRVVAEAAAANAVDTIQRGLLVNQVAHLLRMRRDEVDHLMRRLRPRSERSGSAAAAPRSAPAARGSEPADPEQGAWARVLEVLLNEPTLLAAAGASLSPDRITDPRDRRIAAALAAQAGNGAAGSLADVLARLTDQADVERATMLADRGADRGNFRNTLECALDQIRRFGASPEEMRPPGFVPRRLSRKAPGPVEPTGLSR